MMRRVRTRAARIEPVSPGDHLLSTPTHTAVFAAMASRTPAARAKRAVKDS